MIASTTPAETNRARRRGAASRMLIVEDDPIAVALVKRAAEACGFVVRAIDSGDAFDTEVTSWRPDVVVLDIIVPGRDGFTLLNDLATRQLHDLPVFVMSGFGDRYLASAARLGRVYGLNIAGEIAKPLRLDRLNDIFTPFKA